MVKELLSCMYEVGCAFVFFFFQAEDGIRDIGVTGVQTCALPISERRRERPPLPSGPDVGTAPSTFPVQLRNSMTGVGKPTPATACSAPIARSASSPLVCRPCAPGRVARPPLPGRSPAAHHAGQGESIPADTPGPAPVPLAVRYRPDGSPAAADPLDGVRARLAGSWTPARAGQ